MLIQRVTFAAWAMLRRLLRHLTTFMVLDSRSMVMVMVVQVAYCRWLRKGTYHHVRWRLFHDSQLDQDPVVPLNVADIIDHFPSLEEQAADLCLRCHAKLLPKLRLDGLEAVDAFVYQEEHWAHLAHTFNAEARSDRFLLESDGRGCSGSRIG